MNLAFKETKRLRQDSKCYLKYVRKSLTFVANLTECKAVTDSKKHSKDKIECPDLTPELGSKNNLLDFKQLYS